MEKKTMMYLGIGVGAAAVIYFITRPSSDEGGYQDALPPARMVDDELSDYPEPYTPPEPSGPTGMTYNSKIGISNSLGLGLYKWFGVKSSDRTKADASLQIGTQGMINGTIPCTISDFYLDSNGQKGSFRCSEIAEGTYDIPNGSRFEY
jgi:hypothetical protein